MPKVVPCGNPEVTSISSPVRESLLTILTVLCLLSDTSISLCASDDTSIVPSSLTTKV